MDKSKYLKTTGPQYTPVVLVNGETIYVRAIPLSEVLYLDGLGNKETAIATWIVRCACDEGGTPVFDDSDIPAISKMDAAWGMPIFWAAKKLNKFTDDKIEEKKS